MDFLCSLIWGGSWLIPELHFCPLQVDRYEGATERGGNAKHLAFNTHMHSCCQPWLRTHTYACTHTCVSNYCTFSVSNTDVKNMDQIIQRYTHKCPHHDFWHDSYFKDTAWWIFCNPKHVSEISWRKKTLQILHLYLLWHSPVYHLLSPLANGRAGMQIHVTVWKYLNNLS